MEVVVQIPIITICKGAVTHTARIFTFGSMFAYVLNSLIYIAFDFRCIKSKVFVLLFNSVPKADSLIVLISLLFAPVFVSSAVILIAEFAKYHISFCTFLKRTASPRCTFSFCVTGSMCIGLQQLRTLHT